MSGYLTQRLADNAIDLVRESIKQALELFGRSQLYIIVADKGTGDIITERSIGAPNEKMSRYAALALNKAQLSARTGLSSREVLTMQREALRPGDPKYYGSAIHGDIVVGCSGAQQWWDHTFASWVLASILGLHDEEIEAQLKQDGDTFESHESARADEDPA